MAATGHIHLVFWRGGNRVVGSPTLEESYLSKKEGRRPKNRPNEGRGRLGPRAGIPKRKRPNCHEKRYSRTSVGIAPREGAQRPRCVREKLPKDPGVAAPLAAAGCRGNCWYAGKIFSVASRWTTPSRLPSTSAYVLHGVWLQVHV